MAPRPTETTPPADTTKRPTRGSGATAAEVTAAGVQNRPRPVTKPKTPPKTGGKPSTQAAPPPPAAPVEDWTETAKRMYGGFYSIVESVPELSDLLRNAVENEWTQPKFEYELAQTAWFRNNSAAARTWDIDSQKDPASAQQKIEAQATTIRDMATTLGVTLSEASVQDLAKNSLRLGWSQMQTQNAVGSEAVKTGTPGMTQLGVGYLGQQVRQVADNYGLKLSETSMTEWTNKIATGASNIDGFKNYAIQSAKTLYPSIIQQLDAGQTFKDVVEPYRQLAGRVLEMDSNAIDFTDPKWAQAISHTTDKGEQRPMTFTEFNRLLRSDRSFGYEYTTEARSRAYQVANSVANLFGKV